MQVLDELMFYADGMGALDFPIDPSYIGVYKSDLAVSEHEKNALRDAVRPLEEVPDHLKDWHPNSDGKVLDLVHPSMWPLIVGQTREMPSGTAEFCSMLRYAGAGTVIEDDHPRILMDDEIRDLLSWNERQRHISLPEVFSEHYHWLPAEVEISRSAGSLRTRFTSYVNNLHPELQQPAYAAIESILARCVPLWDRVLADSLRDAAEPTETIPPTTSASQADTTLVSSLRCESFNANCLYGSDYAPVGYADNEEAYSQWYATRTPVQMEAAKFVPPEVLEPSNILSSRQKFQVIVKLANIELGPGKEHYDGGSWHVEGQLNEKIRASAIYYYDECNVSPSRLAFRQTSEELENYEQDDETGLGAIFGMTRDAARLQTLGSVLTREDRIVAFPNSLQHRVSPFELIDKTRRGWRKILAFFLIDPELPIMSTATIPPQRMDWWAAQVKLVQPFAGLPTEIFDLIISVRHLLEQYLQSRRAAMADGRRDSTLIFQSASRAQKRNDSN